MTTLHWVNGLVFFATGIWLVNLMPDVQAFLLGVTISLINLLVFYGFYWWYRRKIPVYQGQALVSVISTTIVRFVLVGGLLVLVLWREDMDSRSCIVGFVLGQFFYLLNQLIKVAANHGK